MKHHLVSINRCYYVFGIFFNCKRKNFEAQKQLQKITFRSTLTKIYPIRVPYMTEYTPGPVFPLASYLARRQYEPGVYMSPGVFIRRERGRTCHKILMALDGIKDLACLRSILRETRRLPSCKSTIQLNNASSMSTSSAFRPAPCNCFRFSSPALLS